eukprot:4447366-Amphidinium_carterae.1
MNNKVHRHNSSINLCLEVIKTKKRRIVPGAWRAFVRLKSLQQSGTPNLSDLASDYRVAKAEGSAMLQHAERLSQAAVLRPFVRQQSRSLSSMGPRAREIKRETLKMHRHALWQQTASMGAVDRGQALAALTKSTQSLHEALSTAKKQQLLDGKAKKAIVQREMDVLAQYEATIGHDTLETVKKSFPSVAWDGLQARCLPCADGPLVFLPGAASPTPSKAVAWASNSHQTNVAASLEREWKESHNIVYPSSDMGEPETSQIKPCSVAGICLCSRDGKLLYKLRNLILKAMKEQFKGQERKTLLTSGNVVMRLTCAQQCETCQVSGKNELFLHIGHMSLNPYRPSFQQLLRFTAPVLKDGKEKFIDLQVAPFLGLVLMLVATLQFFTEYQAFHMACLSCHWTLLWYELEIGARPLDKIAPEYIRVLPLPLQEEGHILWPPEVKKRASKVRHPFLDRSVPEASLIQLSQPLLEPLEDASDLETDQAIIELDDDDDEPLEEDLANSPNAEMLEIAELWETVLGGPVEEPMLVEQETQLNHPLESTFQQEMEDPMSSNVENSNTHANPMAVGVPALGSEGDVCPAPENAALHVNTRENVKRSGVRGALQAALAEVRLPSGRIAYHETKESFEAVCSRHPGCTLSRTCKPRRGQNSAGFPKGGRPLGLLAAWLACDCDSKATHRARAQLESLTHDLRAAARYGLSEVDGGLALLSLEREQADGETSEPELLEGYL